MKERYPTYNQKNAGAFFPRQKKLPEEILCLQGNRDSGHTRSLGAAAPSLLVLQNLRFLTPTKTKERRELLFCFADIRT